MKLESAPTEIPRFSHAMLTPMLKNLISIHTPLVEGGGPHSLTAPPCIKQEPTAEATSTTSLITPKLEPSTLCEYSDTEAQPSRVSSSCVAIAPSRPSTCSRSSLLCRPRPTCAPWLVSIVPSSAPVTTAPLAHGLAQGVPHCGNPSPAPRTNTQRPFHRIDTHAIGRCARAIAGAGRCPHLRIRMGISSSDLGMPRTLLCRALLRQGFSEDTVRQAIRFGRFRPDGSARWSLIHRTQECFIHVTPKRLPVTSRPAIRSTPKAWISLSSIQPEG